MTRSDSTAGPRRRMSRTGILAAIVALTTAASFLSVVFVGESSDAAPPSLVRWDSHRLSGSTDPGTGTGTDSAPGTDPATGTATATATAGSAAQVGETVQLVEFIDFECRRCRAAHPFIEQLREDYAGRVDLVVRYFPLPGHVNSTHAAVAVEAAAQQGAFEEMAAVMWDTHGHWGRSSSPETSLFRSYAAELGLDMTAYDAAVADPATQARVRQDFEDGVALNVTGTPTYFLDGVLVRPVDEQHFRTLLDEALASRGSAPAQP